MSLTVQSQHHMHVAELMYDQVPNATKNGQYSHKNDKNFRECLFQSGAIPCLHSHVPSPEVTTASHHIVQPIAAMMGSSRHGVHLLSPRQLTTERAFLTSRSNALRCSIFSNSNWISIFQSYGRTTDDPCSKGQPPV